MTEDLETMILDNAERPAKKKLSAGRTSQCIDWFSGGESKTVEVAGVRVTIRFVGRKGRRGRISITAPPGAVFRSDDPSM